MKKRALSALLALCLCLALLPVSALAADSDFTIENGVLTKYNGAGGDVIIPDGVTSIGKHAFENCTGLTSVILPDSITTLGLGAFRGCTALTSITISNSTTQINPDSIPSHTTVYGYTGSTAENYVFFNGSPFVSIDKDTNKQATGLNIEYRYLLNSDRSFDYSTVQDIDLIFKSKGSANAYTNVEFKDMWEELKPDDIYDTPINITFPNTVKTISGIYISLVFKFDDYDIRTSLLTNPGLYGMYDEKLKFAVTIPDSVTEIDFYAFSGCTGLSEITLGEGLKRIGKSAFANCPALYSVSIPESVTEIGLNAFDKQYVTLLVTAGSYAETWAKENSIKYTTTGGNTNPQNPPKDTQTLPISTIPTLPTTPPVTDPTSSWATAQVNAAIAASLVPSSLQAKYTQATTRAEFCALAVALYESIKGEITERKEFTDTTDINVQKCAFIGVVSGTNSEQTIFDPNAQLTREQAASMLSRLAAAMDSPLTGQGQGEDFADSASVSDWAVGAVKQVRAAGIMGGIAGNKFDPKGAYTREQSISTIMRLFNMENDQIVLRRI